MVKIDFKQPKYIFPLVIFVPLCALIYFVMQTFGVGGEEKQKVATDRINTELPEANAQEAGSKMYEMSRRFGDEDAFTAVGGLGEEQEETETLDHGYSEEELNRIDAAEAERLRQQRELEDMAEETEMTAILRLMISHRSLNRYRCAVMKGRRRSRRVLDSTPMPRLRLSARLNSVPIPLPRLSRRSGNATVRSW